MTNNELSELFLRTSFADTGEPPTWSDLSIDESDGHIFVPQCSYLGHTLISLGDTYEDSGDDCYFIQKLLELWMSGRLKVV